MRVCFISTYPPTECGIATYTKYLSDAVKQLGNEIIIVSQDGSQGENVFPAFSPLDNDISVKLFQLVSKLTPDIINVQHEFGLFGSDRGVQIVDFLLRCKIHNIPTITSIHSVYEKLPKLENILLEAIISASSWVIVHEKYQKEKLKKTFPQWDYKVSTIQHGIRNIPRIKNANEILGMEGKKILLLIGYLRPSKGFHKIVELMPRIIEKNKNIVLLVACKKRGLEYSDYKEYFFRLIDESTVKDKLKILYGQFPQHTFDTILSAANVLVLPYESGAQSGILAQASAFQLPVVLSEIKSFRYWNDKIKGGLIAKNDNDYVDHIVKILSNNDLEESLRKNIEINTKDHIWLEIAKVHLKLFKQLIYGPTNNAEYFYVHED